MAASGGRPGNILDRLWELDPVAIGGLKGRGVRILQFLTFAGSNFFAHNGLLRATALAFTNLLSLVPLLALAFSVLKGFGAQNRLAPLLIKEMSAGSEVVVNRIITYIGNTNMGSVGAIGLAALIYTSLNMLGNIEESFNVVWGVTATRTFYRKFSDYLSVLISAPILLLAATSITTTLHSKRVIWLLQNYLGDVFLFLLYFTRYLSIWTALFLLYMFMPNIRVRYRSALVGAVLAGTLWQLAQWAYINFQIGAGNYNAIYGTLAALPILMVWIYASWVIILFGMEVVAAHQNLKTFRRELRGGEISESLRELVALAVMRHIGESFREGGPAWDAEHLAGKLAIPLPAIRETLSHLTDAGFIVHAGGARGGYYPAREPDTIALDQVILSLRAHGASCRIAGEEQAEQILERVDHAVSAALEGVTLKEFASPENPLQSPPKNSAGKAPADVDKPR